MYKLLLISRYLRRKLVPLFAVLAVTLCTAMVIIVISVMGGFLNLMRQSAKTLSGDVAIMSDITGFPYYEKMLDRLERMPEVAAAAPSIEAYGLINLQGQVQPAQLTGVDPERIDPITGFRESLYWTRERILEDLDPDASDRRKRWEERDLINEAMNMRVPLTKDSQLEAQSESGSPSESEAPTEDRREPKDGSSETTDAKTDAKTEWVPGIVPGIEVNPFNQRTEDGSYDFFGAGLGIAGSGTHINQPVVLTVLPLSQRGAVLGSPAVRTFRVANEFKSGLYQLDANRVYMPFEQLQEMLRMEPRVSRTYDPETGEPVGEPEKIPGRVTEVLVKASPGITADRLAEAVWAQAVQPLLVEHPQMPLLRVRTWEQRHQGLLNAVEKEKGLLVVLFAIISVVAVVMVAVIFYMIVLAKTRDIGIMRAMGASQWGIAGIFLGYGLAIGVLGSILGFGLGASIVWNLNEIQSLLYQWFGFQMWDPRIYYFDRIPSQVDPVEVATIMVLAVVSSLVGSLVPAFFAARLDPVESLRYE